MFYIKKVNDTFGERSYIIHPDGYTFLDSDEDNRHYKEYLKWVAEGNEAEEVEQ